MGIRWCWIERDVRLSFFILEFCFLFVFILFKVFLFEILGLLMLLEILIEEVIFFWVIK